MRSRTLTLLVVVTATACGATGAGTPGGCEVLQLPASGPGDVGDLFPITAGSTWAYTVSDSSKSTPQRISVTSSSTAGGTATFRTAYLDDPAVEDMVILYAKSTAGVTFTTDPSLPAPFDGYAHAWLVFPLDAGRTLQSMRCAAVDIGADLDGDGRNDTADLDMQVSVIGDEIQAVPAGTFTARRVETRITYTVHGSAGRSASATSTEVDWLAPGVGLVRQTVNATGAGGSFSGDASLAGYSVGARHGGVVLRPSIATAVAPGSSDTEEVRVGLAAGAGAVLAAWRQPGSFFGQDAVRAARVDAGAGQAPAAFDVFDSRGSSGHPAVAFDGANHLLVTGLCVGTTGCGRIQGQRISPTGARLDGGDGISIAGQGSSTYGPSVAGGQGGWLVAWMRYNEGLYVVPVSAAGVVGSPTLLRADPQVNTGSAIVGVAHAAGTYLVAWTEGPWSGPMTVLASRVTPQGVVLDPQPITISTAPGMKSVATVVSDGSRFYVVWLDGRSGAAVPGAGYPLPDVYVARVAVDGTLLDGPAAAGGILVNGYQSSSTMSVANAKRSPAAAWDGHQLVVAWWVDAYGPPGGVYVARVSSSGTALDSPSGLGVLVAAGGVDRLVNPALAPLPDGSTLAAWIALGGKDIGAAVLYW